MYPLRYLTTGHVYIDPSDDCDKVVDALLETDYSEEFCLARDFEEDFISRLMEAGFLVMSVALEDEGGGENESPQEPFYILLPKLHLARSALLFPELHIKRSIRRFLKRYELRVNTDFDLILDKCIAIHGAQWLTPPLAEILKSMHRSTALANLGSQRMETRGKASPWLLQGKDLLSANADGRVMPVSFAVYRDGELKAGEIGVAMEKVYTSYSGFYEEDNAGMVQMILMAQWMGEMGFAFLDFGMPLDYKTALGAQNIEPRSFVELFRSARYKDTVNTSEL